MNWSGTRRSLHPRPLLLLHRGRLLHVPQPGRRLLSRARFPLRPSRATCVVGGGHAASRHLLAPQHLARNAHEAPSGTLLARNQPALGLTWWQPTELTSQRSAASSAVTSPAAPAPVASVASMATSLLPLLPCSVASVATEVLPSSKRRLPRRFSMLVGSARAARRRRAAPPKRRAAPAEGWSARSALSPARGQGERASYKPKTTCHFCQSFSDAQKPAPRTPISI